MRSRTTGRAERLIAATPERLWQAWFGEGELERWLPLNGLSARVSALDPVPGGDLRLELAHQDPTALDDAFCSIEIKARFIDLDPPYRFVFDAFPSEPAAGADARMEWQFLPEGDGTRVVVTCHDMPQGMSPDLNEKALGEPLPRLAAHVERSKRLRASPG